MLFSPELYPRPVAGMILDGTKTQTRRRVKEGEYCKYYEPFQGEKRITSVWTSRFYNGKLKWRTGRDYAVQLGRGKSGLWHCPLCLRDIGNGQFKSGLIFSKEKALVHNKNNSYHAKPFRIVITGIRKERLLDITEEGAKKEGFEQRWKFLRAFDKLLKGKLIEEKPNVWVLEFEVKK